MTKTISKSSFIRGMKCHKALWLHFNMPDERDETSESQQNIFNTGYNVGALAHDLFPGGIDSSKDQPENVGENVAYTKELIAGGQEVIYEAAFSDGETLCYIDILVKEGGKWRAYEVKATSKIKDYHILDAAFQYYVITSAGLLLEEMYLVHLNTGYVRRGAIDVQLLFTKNLINDIILPMQPAIPGNLQALQAMLLGIGAMPDIPMGVQCTDPYNCDFMEFCQRDIVVEPEVGNPRPASRDQQALDDFKVQLEFPLFFFDFETIMPPVPYHDKSRPYQQLPFQYSLHVVRTPEMMKQPEHYYYLGNPPFDPRPALIETLMNQIGTQGSILVWHQSFEISRLRELARDFPQYAMQIDAIFPRIVDLIIPFRRKYLYTPEMNGSASLKSVFPALVHDLSYDDLAIQEGGTASQTYLSIYDDPDPESVTKKMNDLLEYCWLDTMSMVRILGML
jgi:hypothetical protein